MNETKKIINDYEIIQSFYVGEKEVVVGENKNAEYKYNCGYYESNEIFEINIWIYHGLMPHSNNDILRRR